jgi:hypothetical protein
LPSRCRVHCGPATSAVRCELAVGVNAELTPVEVPRDGDFDAAS